jgi:hypothetical protein
VIGWRGRELTRKHCVTWLAPRCVAWIKTSLVRRWHHKYYLLVMLHGNFKVVQESRQIKTWMSAKQFAGSVTVTTLRVCFWFFLIRKNILKYTTTAKATPIWRVSWECHFWTWTTPLLKFTKTYTNKNIFQMHSSCEISGSHGDEYEGIFWDPSPCSLVEIYRHFRGAYCLHHSWRRPVSTRVHGARSQKTVICILLDC